MVGGDGGGWVVVDVPSDYLVSPTTVMVVLLLGLWLLLGCDNILTKCSSALVAVSKHYVLFPKITCYATELKLTFTGLM